MEKFLLPTEQAELAKSTERVVEAERLLREAGPSAVGWAWLPAIPVAVGLYLLLGELEVLRAARVLLSVVSALAVSAAVEARSMRKRLAAVEALVQELRIRLRQRNAG